jgi:glutaminyl-peptide cyclotransferase
MSDGSPVLRFVDPATFTVRRHLTVTDGGRPVRMLNELEYVDGEILANIWLTDLIARIDPQDGHVIGWIDVSELHRQSGATAENDVPNGIAWDAKKRRLFVTGKDWPYVFQIKAPKDVASSADAAVSTP